MSDVHAVVGIRELSLSNGGKVVVSLDVPVLFAEDESEYCCSYTITGLQETEEGRVIGSDALQALQLTLMRIGSILYTSEEWKNNFLSWNGDKDLGFPLPDSLKDLLP